MNKKCRVLVRVFLQTFRAWPFISYKVRWKRLNVCIRRERKKNFVVLAFCTRPRGYGSRSLSRVDDWC